MSLTVKEINGLIQWIDDGFKPVKKPHGKGWLKQEKPAGKAQTPVKLFDGNGLHLLVTPNGSRGWRYRYRFAGREKLISLGVYPKTGLQKARDKRKEVEQQHADGLDPSVVRQEKRSQEKAARLNTFAAAIWEWSDRYHTKTGAAKSTKVRNERIVKYLVVSLGKTAVAEITRPAVLSTAERIEKEHGTETAHRALSLARLFFEHLAVKGMITGDPTVGVRQELGEVIDKPRSAIVEPKKIGQLLRDIWNYQGQPATIAALKLLAHTFLRPGELRQATWSEIDFESAEWIIPTARLKQRRAHPEPHLVPLSDQVLGILQELHQITGPDGFVFPSTRKGRPLSENAFRVALLNLGYDGNTHHAHGFRKLASTRLHALNFDSRIIEKQLAHAVPGVAGKYNTYDYAAERRDMLQSWSDHLDSLRKGDNVVAISSPPRR